MEEGAAFAADRWIPLEGDRQKIVLPDGDLRPRRTGILQIRESISEVRKTSPVVIGKGKGICIDSPPAKTFKSPSLQLKNAMDKDASSSSGLKLIVNKFNIPSAVEDVCNKTVDTPIKIHQGIPSPNKATEVLDEGNMEAVLNYSEEAIGENRGSIEEDIQKNQNDFISNVDNNIFNLLVDKSTEEAAEEFSNKVEDLEEGEIKCHNSDLSGSSKERMDELIKSKGKLLKELSSLGNDNIIHKKRKEVSNKKIKNGSNPIFKSK
ncbi:hypothetical protein MA16_Dca021607 [Dendrobium catenatum]|uniref:Uncharacterized protein n=1 Tax=Dendrobium catenatum TaxID=906689 RepID=A0A2I0W3N5_9ASPA|nr:hypothetical protein MA16_Dca021607 [Dendrobium catenatum]